MCRVVGNGWGLCVGGTEHQMSHESGVNPKLRKTKKLANRISDLGVKSEAIRPTALTWCEASMQFSCRQLAKNAIPLWAFLPSGTISYMIRSLAKKGHKYTGGLNKNGVVSNLDIWLVSLTSISVYTKALHRLLATLIYRYTYLLRQGPLKIWTEHQTQSHFRIFPLRG